MQKQFVPSFRCQYCGETKEAFVDGEEGVFVPCDCEEARGKRDRAHWEEMERRKQLRRQNR